MTGQYEALHAERDWADEAAAADLPIFMIHGVHDNAARIPASEWFFGGRFERENDKVWIGQWDHGSTNGRCGDTDGARTLHSTCRFDQFQYALHAWFDHHVQQRNVDTGPAVEAFLNARDAGDVTEVLDEDGDREPVDFCAAQPQLRDGVDTISPVVPGEVMALDMQCFTVAQWVPAGQRLELEVSTGSQHHATFGDTNPQITVHTGPELTRYRAPLMEGALLHDDVPLRENGDDAPDPVGSAQRGVSGNVTVLAPGGGMIAEPVTAAAFEFRIETGYDNARIEVLATPALPADLDLYLQRRNGESWSENLAAGESSELDHEALVAGRQVPGDYRIVVHNWAGPPNDVEVAVTFLNGDGEPAPAT